MPQKSTNTTISEFGLDLDLYNTENQIRFSHSTYIPCKSIDQRIKKKNEPITGFFYQQCTYKMLIQKYKYGILTPHAEFTSKL